LLAPRAVERAAAADDGAHDGAPAARARLAGAVVHLEFTLHPTLAATRVDVVSARRAAETDALAEDEPQRLAQPRDLIGAERSGRAQRVDARAPQRFDGVDVPHSGDAALVEQQRLDGGPAAQFQEIAQPARGKARRQRLDAEHAVERHTRTSPRTLAVLREIRAVDDRHTPELPRVGETEGGAVGEPDDGADKRVLRRAALAEEQLSGHAQGDDDRLVAVELEHDELAAPADAGDLATAEARREVRRWDWLRHAMPERLESRDASPDHELAQLPRDRLDLGQLRHVRRQAVGSASSRPSSYQRGRRR